MTVASPRPDTYVANVADKLAHRRFAHLSALVVGGASAAAGLIATLAGTGPVRAGGVAGLAFGVLLLATDALTQRHYRRTGLPSGIGGAPRYGFDSDRGATGWTITLGVVFAAVLIVAGVTGGGDTVATMALLLIPMWGLVAVVAVIGVRTRARAHELLDERLEQPEARAELNSLRAAWPEGAPFPFE
ncbi:MAG: hypothetical protein IPL41_13690 [Micropruina sp.]|nr:hypothetical protein [Micropruina sp.]